MNAGIRNEYQAIGIDTYYSEKGDEYSNPHSKDAVSCLNAVWNDSWTSVLDFACGDGLMTKALSSRKIPNIVGCDKFMSSRYEKETQKNCLKLSFEEVANFEHELPLTDIVVFSYAIDIVPSTYLSGLLYALSCSTEYLLVIRPNNHKLEHFSWSIDKEVRFGKARGVLYKKKK